MAGIRGVIFDKDGTLFDFNATWSAWAAAFLIEIAGGDIAQATALGRVIGYDVLSREFDASSPVIAGTPDQVASALLPHLPGESLTALVSRMNASAAVAPMIESVPLKPLIAALKRQGIRIGLATNDGELPARAHLISAGVHDDFDFVAGFDSGFGAKPAPGMLLAFADRFGLAPSEVAMVGDSLHDLAAARAAGMHGVGVLSGPATARELQSFAAVVLPNIGELPNWLGAELTAA